MSKLRQNDYSDRLKQIRDKYESRQDNRDHRTQDTRYENMQNYKYEKRYQPRPDSNYSVKDNAWEPKCPLEQSSIFTLRDTPGQSTPYRLIFNPQKKSISHRHIPQKEQLKAQMQVMMQRKTKRCDLSNNYEVEPRNREEQPHKDSQYDPIQSYRIKLRSALKQIQGCSDSQRHVPDLKSNGNLLQHHLPINSKQSVRQESYRPLKGSSSYNMETSPVRKWEAARVDENECVEGHRKRTEVADGKQKYGQLRVETLKVAQCPYNVGNIDRIQQKIQNAVGSRSRR